MDLCHFREEAEVVLPRSWSLPTESVANNQTTPYSRLSSSFPAGPPLRKIFQMNEMAPNWRPVHFDGIPRCTANQEVLMGAVSGSNSAHQPLSVSPKSINTLPSDFFYGDTNLEDCMPSPAKVATPKACMTASRPDSERRMPVVIDLDNYPPKLQIPPTLDAVPAKWIWSHDPSLSNDSNMVSPPIHQFKDVLQRQQRRNFQSSTCSSKEIPSESLAVPRHTQFQESYTSPISATARPILTPLQEMRLRQHRNDQVSDILRRPSLYSIPSWPSPTMKQHGSTNFANAHTVTRVPRYSHTLQNAQDKHQTQEPVPMPKHPRITRGFEEGAVEGHGAPVRCVRAIPTAQNENDEEQPPRKRVCHMHPKNV